MNEQQAGVPAPVLLLIVLVAIAGLAFAIIKTALNLRPSRRGRSGASALKTWATLGALVAFLIIVILGTPSFFLLAHGR
ncbi:MAG TPA: hypothetical protein VHF26_14860 [Trebonia sp.]|nr:hypothetical protein [Trebonia sp.]